MNMCLFVSPVSRWPNGQYIVNSSFMIPTFSNFKLPYGFRRPIAYKEEGVRKHADGTDRLQVFHENCWFVCKFINFHGSWSKLQMGWVPWYWKGSTYSILGVLVQRYSGEAIFKGDNGVRYLRLTLLDEQMCSWLCLPFVSSAISFRIVVLLQKPPIYEC